MRTLMTAAVLALALAPLSARAGAPGPVPRGKLPDAARPIDYRLDLTVLPDQSTFSGHVEIDVELKVQTTSLYLHGRDLKVTAAVARSGAGVTGATWTQVDPTGVARLDFARALPPGKVTLVFDYSAPFGDTPSGLYHIKVGDDWYAWTQFESIDARAAFPGFDEPGFKTPFTVSLTTRPGFKTVSNAPETGAVKTGELVRHSFAETRPLPTYLMAFVVGPFASANGAAAPDAERKDPLPVEVVATKPNAGKLGFALENTGPIVDLLERYFGRPFPFPKLDQIASPVMPGAMENAGADTYGDNIILLDETASTDRKQTFGMVVAHELSHQWFGDLVTPKWWDDIWLNESFANWMGYRIGNAWRPDLKINTGAIAEAFRAMNTDALEAGRPIHQHIETNDQIDSAFDAVTYGKGGQVVAMIAAYMGDERFRDGVRLHMDRHAYGNASTDEFFQALADAGQDPRILAALRSFVDQQGVPVVHVERTAGGLAVSQARYALLGSKLKPETWTIPLCLRIGETRSCTLLDKASAEIAATAKGPIVPNAGGLGYYRFTLPEAEWRSLIAASPSLPAGEALATTDSLWASFRAGEIKPELLIAAARAMAANPSSDAVTDGGERLASLRERGLITEAALPAYRRLIASIYGPKLARLGFDPRAGAYAAEDPDVSKLRADVVDLMATEANDAATSAKLTAAAQAYLDGDKAALDQAYLVVGLQAYLRAGGPSAAQALLDKAKASSDSLLRGAAFAALPSTGDPAIGEWLLSLPSDPALRTNERLRLLGGLGREPATRDLMFRWLTAHVDELVAGKGIFLAGRLPGMAGGFCSAKDAAMADAFLRPLVEKYHAGGLQLDRTLEQVRSCGALREARGAEITAAILEAGK